MTAETLAETQSAELSPLSEQESNRLAELEAIITTGLSQFLIVGSALAEVHQSRLYRAEYSSFQDYLENRWHLSKSRGLLLIRVARLFREIEPLVAVKPTSSASLIPLVPLERTEDKAAVWNLAAENAGKDTYGRQLPPTYSEVKSARDELGLTPSFQPNNAGRAGKKEQKPEFKIINPGKLEVAETTADEVTEEFERSFKRLWSGFLGMFQRKDAKQVTDLAIEFLQDFREGLAD